MEGLSKEAFREEVKSIYCTLSTYSDLQTRENISDKHFALTQHIDKEAHVYSLVFRANFSEQQSEQLYTTAYELARKLASQDLINMVEHSEQLLKQKLQQAKQRIVTLITSLFILLSILLVILILYFKLYNSRMELIRRTLKKEAE